MTLISDAKVIVFDLDDTLFPEHEFVYSGFRSVGQWMHHRYGISQFFEVCWTLFQQGQRGSIFNQALDQLQVPYQPPLIQTLIQIYRDHDPTITLHPDARWAINHYRVSHTLGLITNGALKTQQNKVKALGIESHFNPIIYCDFYGSTYWKPSPFPYQKLMEQIGFSGKDYLYIGDHPHKDFIAAKQLGWLTLRICRPDGQHTALTAPADQDAHHRITSLYDLLTLS